MTTWQRWRGELIVVAAVMLVFGRAVTFEFVGWDDDSLVVNNPLLRLDANALWQMWAGPVLGLYTPMAYTTWAVLASVFGKAAWVFHAYNVILHAVCGVLCYRLILRRTRGWTDGRGDFAAAIIAALWWALHPLKVEPVAWVAGMNNLLAGMFSLAALVVMERPGAWSESGGIGWRRWGLATLWYALALLSKPTALVVLPVATVLAWTRGGRPGRWWVMGVRAGVWAMLALVFIKLGSEAQPAQTKHVPGIVGRVICAVDAVGWYSVSTVVPYELAVDHARRPVAVLAELNGAGGGDGGFHVAEMLAVGAGVLGLGLVGAWRRWWVVAMGMGVFVVALGPVLGLRPFAFQTYSTVSERYAYLATVGPALMLAWVVVWARRTKVAHPTVVTVGAMTLCAGLAIWSAVLLSPWHDTVSLFTHAAKTNPRSVQGQRSLAYLAKAQGRIRDAVALYRQVIAQRPDDVLSLYNLGNLMLSVDPQDSYNAYSDALLEAEDRNLIAMIRTNRGVALQQLGKDAEAEQDYRVAIASDKNYAPPVSNLAFLLEKRGDPIAARELYRRALKLDPNLGPAQRGLARLGG
jgi:Tfp pilus assembly protein PilF